jgi:hypothetical protein
LLLSIIRAYRHPDGTGEADRLAAAREALFGEKRERGRTAVFDDLALFKINAEVRKRELVNLRNAVAKLNPSANSAVWDAETTRAPMKAREAARHFSDLAGTSENVSDDAVEHRLRRKARKPLSTRDMAELEALFDTGAPHTRTIIAILDLLEGLGVASRTIWDENT